MIQDIYPSRLQNEYKDYVIRDEDILLKFDKDGKKSHNYTTDILYY